MIISRRMKWPGYVAPMGLKRNSYRFFVGKLEGKIPLGRIASKREDNIKKDFRDKERNNMDLINLAQDTDQWRALPHISRLLF
jgi:hypothetical protein